MKLTGQTRVALNEEARELINLYASLGERAANILPDGVFEKLKNFIRICHDEQMEPAIQKAAISQALLEVKEALPGYTDISLMLAPHRNSKAFEFSARRQTFKGEYLSSNGKGWTSTYSRILRQSKTSSS